MKSDNDGDLTLPTGMRSEYDDELPRPVPQVPSVNNEADALIDFVNGLRWKDAWLPADYAVLNKAVAGIQDIDKLAEIANKAEALASYEHARRENEVAVRNLKRTATRIWIRMGELYKQSVAPGARSDRSGNLAHACARSGAIVKGAKIGHSRKQVEQAVLMAECPPDVAEAALRADPPLSKTAIAKEGRKARAATKPPPESLAPSDPRHPANKEATKLLNAASAMTNINAKLALTPGALEPDEIEALLADCAKIERLVARVRETLQPQEGFLK